MNMLSLEIVNRKAMESLIGFKIGVRNGIPDDDLSLAIEALKKQIPSEPKIQSWSPALCPSCGEELSESLGDGYYKHYTSKITCNCGQKLKWQE